MPSFIKPINPPHKPSEFFRDEVERLEAEQVQLWAALEAAGPFENVIVGPDTWFSSSAWWRGERDLHAICPPALARGVECAAGRDPLPDIGLKGMLAPNAAPVVSVTIITNAHGPATKVYSDHDGEPVIEGKLYKKSAANIYEGTTERRQVAGVRGHLAFINELKSTETSGPALFYGVTEAETTRVITQKALKKLNGSAALGVIARDAEHCRFAKGEPGIFLGDYDPYPRPGHPLYSAQELDDILCGLFPQLAAVERAWRPSATAFIYDRDGNELKGSWGWRLYFVVDDASQIPRIGAAIYQALWATGHGYIKLTKSGARRDYALLDSCVWQGERLDFAAPPIFKDGLMRRLPEELGDLGALIFPGEPMLRAATIEEVPPLDKWRKVSPELAEAKGDKKIKRESAKARKTFTDECADKIEKKGGAPVDRKAFAKAIRLGKIPADLILYPEDGGEIRAGDLLLDPGWHEKRFADPFDPGYMNDARIAIAFVNGDGRAWIYSHAHGGGQTYRIDAPAPDPQVDPKVARIEAAGFAVADKAVPGKAEEHAPALSDQDLALRFVREHADDLRYLKAWDKWLHYDGTRWRKDDTLFAFDLARMMCLKIAGKVEDKDMQHRLASAGAVASTVRLASANRQFASAVEQWDADPWLLCTPGGTVDLRRTKSNGNLRPHRADDYLTKMTAVAPDPNCPTPLWTKFLERVTGEDITGATDFQDYLQRMCGYMATGSIEEHAMFFLWGTGANGKSVFIETIAGILGDYHRVAASETFFDTGGERHPTDLAGLQGARAVTLTETEEGGKWNESKIKKLTGGDTITARFMRQDYFDYKPQFKPLVAGNHRPSLRSIDEAIKRRMHLIPFQVTIPEGERDKELSEKLKAEWPGILAWIIRGCIDWQEEGLKPPKAVTDATQEYFKAEDHLGNWIGERCDRDPSGFESSEDLFDDWRQWAARSGLAVRTKTKLTQNLKERGFKDGRGTTGARGLEGIRFNAEVQKGREKAAREAIEAYQRAINARYGG